MLSDIMWHENNVSDSTRMHLWQNESFISIRLDWQLKIANDWKNPINKIDIKTPRNFIQYAMNFLPNPVYEVWQMLELLCVIVMHKTFFQKNQMHLSCVQKKNALWKKWSIAIAEHMKNCQCTFVEQPFFRCFSRMILTFLKFDKKNSSDQQIINSWKWNVKSEF